MKIFNKAFGYLLWIIFCPIKKLLKYRTARFKKKILLDETIIKKSNDFYKLKALAWEFYDEANFALSEKLAQRLVLITETKGEFPGSNGLLANAYSILGLIIFATDKKQAEKYLIKTANFPIFNQEKRLFLLAQKLFEVGKPYPVLTFLKKKANFMGGIKAPKMFQKQINDTVIQLRALAKEINQGKIPKLTLRRYDSSDKQ